MSAKKRIFAIVKKYGLIGKTLTHSWSQRWFEAMFAREKVSDTEYRLYELPSATGVRQWALDNGLAGFNVTIPYKEQVLTQLDSLDATADAIGAVNCVRVVDGKLLGTNTDAPAFRDTLRPLLQPWHQSALVLGTGGAAKAVCHALNQLNIESTMVSRNPEENTGSIDYLEAAEHATNCFIIINATPVGMHPYPAGTPWPHPSSLTHKHLCYDLVYNPMQTRFLKEAMAQGATIQGGLAMLERQAQLSWEYWTKEIYGFCSQ